MLFALTQEDKYDVLCAVRKKRFMFLYVDVSFE